MNELYDRLMVARLVTQPTRIGTICDIGSSKRIKMSDYVSEGVPFFRSKEIIELSEGRTPSLELFIKSEHYEKLNKRFGSPQAGDILLTSVGTLGVPYYVEREQLPFYFKDGNLTWMKNFTDKINSKWLYYWLISKLGQNNILAYSIGSTQKAITIDALKKIELEIPSRDEQDKVVEILDIFSDKLRNNRHSNQSLQNIIQTLFRSWFIDFDPVKANAEGKLPYGMDEETAALFPYSFKDSELGQIPTGWKLGRVEDILDVSWGDTDVTKKSYSEEGFPAFSAKGQDGYLQYYDYEQWGIVLSAIGANCGNTWIASGKWSCIKNTMRFIELKAENEFVPYFYYLSKNPYFWPIRGSAQPFIGMNDVKKINILIPNSALIQKFSEHSKKMLDTLHINETIGEKLSRARDALLQRLMSGDLPVS
jgi:type I restriction enzyme S subunit